MANVIITIKEFLLQIIALAVKWGTIFIEWFLGLEPAEKGIALTNIPCLLSIIIPSAYFEIFNSRYYVNNPVSISAMILILAFSLSLTVYDKWPWIFWGRIVMGAYYLLILLSKVMFHTMTKADPYGLYWGYYLAVSAAIAYIVFSVISRMYGERHG